MKLNDLMKILMEQGSSKKEKEEIQRKYELTDEEIEALEQHQFEIGGFF